MAQQMVQIVQKMHLVIIGGKIHLVNLYGLYYNIGPFGEENWWSSDAKGNELLYTVDVIIAL
jgi:hypothetical protein